VKIEIALQRDLFWPHPLLIAKTNFKHKALACWHLNPAVGCSHGCRFCYVPSVSCGKQKDKLSACGVNDPAREWGNYVLPRVWDENEFRRSLKIALGTVMDELLPDGNRAIMFSSTTDPFQVSRHPHPDVRAFHGRQLDLLMRRSLEMIRDESDLRVRILTRSPLAEQYFDLMRTFGNRLLFGMSIPSMDDKLVRLYEPKAPAATRRIETLKRAKDEGIPTYLAVAPTFPEEQKAEFTKFITVIKDLDPVTIFHEPVNIRGKNVTLMEDAFEMEGAAFHSDVFEDRKKWSCYAMRSLLEFEGVAHEAGLADRLKLWPDEALLSNAAMAAIVEAGLFPDSGELEDWVRAQWAVESGWPEVSQMEA